MHHLLFDCVMGYLFILMYLQLCFKVSAHFVYSIFLYLSKNSIFLFYILK